MNINIVQNPRGKSADNASPLQLTAGILACHRSRNSTGVTNNTNDGSVLIKCPLLDVLTVSQHEQYAETEAAKRNSLIQFIIYTSAFITASKMSLTKKAHTLK